MTKKQKKELKKIIAASILFAIAVLLPDIGLIKAVFYLAAYLTVGFSVLKKAVHGITGGQVFDENFLMAVASIGAIAIEVYDGSSEYTEAAAVMLLYQIGEFFQGYAIGKSRRNITQLMDIRPDYANIEEDGKLIQVDPDEVAVGSVIIVQPGEKLPIDGIVVNGSSTLNTSALTGESLPREVQPGDEVISGSINMTGLLKIRTTKDFGESTVSKILELVENASSRKSKSEEFISKFARIYTPAVCYSALALAIAPPLARLLMGSSALWSQWIYRALTFLVISCPCALVISIPLSFFAGIGGASREGILIKGSNYLETLSKVKIVVCDKTGTLTKGVFELAGVHHAAMEERRVIEYAALAECASSHPIAKSIQTAYGKEIDRSRVSGIEEISGCGILAIVDGHKAAVGNDKLMKQLNISCAPCSGSGTVIHVAVDGSYAGYLLIADAPKENSKKAVERLKKTGIEKVIMLTGDAQTAAENAAKELGIDEFHAALLPADKVALVEKMLESCSENKKLAFVGDGINDAPVLSRADIGIAMGAIGSDAAIEAADIVLMDDDPLKIPKAIAISKKCLDIVYENITFALVIKFGCLILGALGFANMWLAIFADVGVMILAVLNAMRALRVRNL